MLVNSPLSFLLEAPSSFLPLLTCLIFQLGFRPVTPEQMLGVIEELLAALACQAGLYRPALSLSAWGISGKKKRVPRLLTERSRLFLFAVFFPSGGIPSRLHLECRFGMCMGGPAQTSIPWNSKMKFKLFNEG